MPIHFRQAERQGAWGDEFPFAIPAREWSSRTWPRYDPCPSGAVAQLAKAPVSKTGDSRFESWLPRNASSDVAPNLGSTA